MSYVDGFVLPIAQDRLADYREIAATAAEVWREHGALQYVEATGDDLEIDDMKRFGEMAACTPGETVVFAWIL